jgi:ureidoglycolate hydrolase
MKPLAQAEKLKSWGKIVKTVKKAFKKANRGSVMKLSNRQLQCVIHRQLQCVIQTTLCVTHNHVLLIAMKWLRH